jgi:hypothetical protein
LVSGLRVTPTLVTRFMEREAAAPERERVREREREVERE